MGEVADPSSPARRVGRYALFGAIASGGMATVYLGRQLGQAGFARTVAIKRLHPQLATEPDFVAMFLDEARLAARIRHPNVVPTLDVVATDGELFLIMDYVQGESLARLLRCSRERKELAPTRIVAAIVADVLHGLHAAHEATNERGEPLDLVHRDVSPHNILVGVDGVARLVDFGVAKAAGRLQTTREGQLKGKLAYMAPEQITGVVTRKTDVYAASVCLWEALTSRRLFQGDNDGALLHQVLNGPVRPPSEIVPGLDPAWDPIVLRGLARDEGRRYATAREMAVDIETRLPLARATEVGVWVEALAHEKLAARAAAVKALESGPEMNLHDAESSSWKPALASPHSPIALPAAPAEETAATTIIDDARPRESNTSPVHPVSWPLSASSGATRRSRAAFAAVGVGAVGMLVAVLVFVRPTNGVAASSSASAAAASVAPSPVPSAAPSSPVTPDVPAVASAPPAASMVATASAPPRASKAPSAHSPPPPTKATVLGAVLDTRH